MMRIAFLEAHDPARPGRLFMPMGLAYLAAFVEQEMEAQAHVVHTVEEALALEPDLVGVSSVTPNFPFATRMAREIRAERDVPVVLGGPHVTGLPSSLPDEFAAGVLGEGEETFLEIARLLERTGRVDDLSAIRGVVYKNGADRPVTPARPFIRPLDRIPRPKRDWTGLVANGLWSFSSRGCPYRCRFCSTAEFWESYRMHSARYVIDELNAVIREFDPQYHAFMDDLFAVNIKRLAEIVELARTDLTRRMDLTVTIRADLVSERMCGLLTEMGVKYVHLGLESGSDRVLSYLKKESTTAAVNQAAIDLLSERGIRPIGSFIIGAPMEEEDDIRATYDFIERNVRASKLLSFTFGPLVPFPGTAVWEQARARGLVDERDMDWTMLDIDIRFFDPARYILLSEKMSRARFTGWFERFNELWESTKGTIPERMAHYDRRPIAS
jgi:radical SAM superfamily enzyme YgiQ (UPF0313 family)